MKWTNKGHEFDDIADRLKSIRKIYIYGANKRGREMIDLLGIQEEVVAFVDYNKERQRDGYCGKPVISQNELLKLSGNDYLVVMAIDNNVNIRRKLILSGFREGENLFDYQMFLNFYFPIFSLYSLNKLYIQKLYMIITERCTLRCKGCSANIPNIDKPKDFNKELIFDNLKTLFSNVDYLGNLYLTGGEALLHADIAEILPYILHEYKNKIGELIIITNGNINIDDDTIEILKHPKIKLLWTDYTKNIDSITINERINRTINQLREENIRIHGFSHEQWDSIDCHNSQSCDKSPEELSEFYSNCGLYAGNCAIICENSIASCGAVISRNEKGMLTERALKDILNLKMLNEDSKKIILEWLMGYTDKGYLEKCMSCSGRGVVNPNKIPVAKQA